MTASSRAAAPAGAVAVEAGSVAPAAEADPPPWRVSASRLVAPARHATRNPGDATDTIAVDDGTRGSRRASALAAAHGSRTARPHAFAGVEALRPATLHRADGRHVGARRSRRAGEGP